MDAPSLADRRPWPVRRLVIGGLVLLAIIAAAWLDLTPRGLMPGRGGWELAARFFEGALRPAIDYEDRSGLPPDAAPFLSRVAEAAVETLRLALAAVSLSLVGGLVLGFCVCSGWWPESARARLGPRVLWFLARTLMTLLRSVHELIWATLFLAAFGLTPLTAVIAIALPYTGTLAKVFAEMCEESPEDTRTAQRCLGASPTQFYFLGLMPRVAAELCSYALYRFECGLRSAAVLGFLGIATLGHSLALSFENLHYREVWTYLYALLALVALFDFWSGAVRRALTQGPADRRHPRWIGASGWALAAGIVWAWTTGGFGLDDMDGGQRWENVRRFAREIMPWPIQQGEGSWGNVASWAQSLLFSGPHPGWTATLNTLALSVVAIVLAAALSWLLIPFAARSLATPHPFLNSTATTHPLRRWAWRGVVAVSRLVLIFGRAIPEYVWAFIFIAFVSDQFWAGVLALALHNAGILGRLGAEIIENADSPAPRGLRTLGASRTQLLAAALVPTSLPRFLVYFFYRWETCLREGTVLGILGVTTLGRLIKDARAADRYDEMIFFVLLGAALVLGGDLISSLARRWVRA
ncbi:MAG: PhnE/PtxC family ABC transporter permease [Verrucomicrobiales bacterium]